MLNKNITCDLKYAIKLKELGFPQKSLFYWSIDTPGVTYPSDDYREIVPTHLNYASAYTSTELDKFLPLYLKTTARHFWKDAKSVGMQEYELKLDFDEGVYTDKRKYLIYYKASITRCGEDEMFYLPNIRSGNFEDFKEANAKAKMIIYLVKHKIIKLEGKGFFDYSNKEKREIIEKATKESIKLQQGGKE